MDGMGVVNICVASGVTAIVATVVPVASGVLVVIVLVPLTTCVMVAVRDA
jgi:hypothetical protein